MHSSSPASTAHPSSVRCADVPQPASGRPGRARSRSRGCVLAALFACSSAYAIAPDALPEGEQVRVGYATILRHADGMRIFQTSGHAIIDWRSFDIGRNAFVRVEQSWPGAVLLNRVSGSATSVLAGRCGANGHLYLVNPNGITIASGGVVGATAFVASTLDIANEDFVSDMLRFTAPPAATGVVIHGGRISVEQGGFAALLGTRIEQSGLIRAPLGRIALGAGAGAMLTPRDGGFLAVTPAASAAAPGVAAIVLSGRVEADGGLVQLSAPLGTVERAPPGESVNLTGVINARGMAGRAGTILIDGEGGGVRLSGLLNASSNALGGEPLIGGRVSINGLRVAIERPIIDVSGAAGSGRARLVARTSEGAGTRDPLLVIAAAAARLDADTSGPGPGGHAMRASDASPVFPGSPWTGAAAAHGGAAGASAAASAPQ
ncbi:MAG: filamentous hemagglutinin N-terminal domain-containing protein [Janthinobacterium lividum]